MVGGGSSPKPGEVSLAHFGVLFLDELPEFNRNVLEMLRQPMEDEKVVISRVKGTASFPSKFMLLASMNPCPCGYYGDPTHECSCSPWQIRNYLSKLSGPLLDRIDMHIEIMPVKYRELIGLDGEAGAASAPSEVRNSAVMRREVEAARQSSWNGTGMRRYRTTQLTPGLIKKYCPLDKESKKLLERHSASYPQRRAHHKIIKMGGPSRIWKKRKKTASGTSQRRSGTEAWTKYTGAVTADAELGKAK